MTLQEITEKIVREANERNVWDSDPNGFRADWLRTTLATLAKTMRDECTVQEDMFPHVDCGYDIPCECSAPDWNDCRTATIAKFDSFIGKQKEIYD